MRKPTKLERETRLYKANLMWPGTKFDTDFEKGCEVITDPDPDGAFNAYDHERVICSYHLDMVKVIWL